MNLNVTRIPLILSVGWFVSFGITSASAHHSTTIYDYTIQRIMTGTVVEYRWTQPHSFVVIDVVNDSGEMEQWNIEVGTPSVNARMGWQKDDIKVGDVITVTVHPVRTGNLHGSGSVFVLADGRTLYGPAASLAGVRQGGPGRGAGAGRGDGPGPGRGAVPVPQ